MNETVLITGASGFLGRRLVQYLQRTTNAYVMTTSRQQEGYLNHLVRDLQDVTVELTQNVETVIHCAWEGDELHTDEVVYQSNMANTLRLLAIAMEAGVKRFVFISSVAIHGDQSAHQKSITEESPINPQTLYAKSKYAVEEALKKACANTVMNLIIVRLPMVYHIDRKAGFGRYIEMVKEKRPLPFAKINNRRTMLALCNFESAVGAILRNQALRQETLIIADNFSQSTTEIMNGIAVAATLPVQLFYVPALLMKISLRMKGRTDEYNELWNDQQISSQYAQKQLAWQPFKDFIGNLSN